MGRALLTDLYELNMAAVFLRRGMTGSATFSLFVRELPASRGFLVAAGLQEALAFLEEFRFEDEDLAYAREVLGYGPDVLEALGGLRFTGGVWAIPEGRVVFAGEPLLEITAPLAEAQIVETVVLNRITLQTLLATKAARCRLAAGGRGLVDFSFRRTQGVEAAMAVARCSAIAGFEATSNVEAARRYGLVASGTMAHSFVEAFPSEIEAFRAFAREFPDRSTFLVDTYDTVGGTRAAIAVIRELGLSQVAAIRLDSGDLGALAAQARAILDGAGLPSVRIVASGLLDEYRIDELVRAGAPIDAFGVGTRMGVSADAPYLDTVYKLVDYEGAPVTKLSAGKFHEPGRKQVFRGPEPSGDVLGLRDEPAPEGAVPLLEPVMVGGRRLAPPEGPRAARARFERDLAGLPGSALGLHHPVPPPVGISERLRRQSDEVVAALRARLDGAAADGDGPPVPPVRPSPSSSGA